MDKFINQSLKKHNNKNDNGNDKENDNDNDNNYNNNNSKQYWHSQYIVQDIQLIITLFTISQMSSVCYGH